MAAVGTIARSRTGRARTRMGPRIARTALAAVGPVAIVVAVLIVQRDLAFGGRLTDQHVDILPMWTPTFGFLGHSLASGSIPAWNPFVFGGQPFAADPQSGWTYLPAMLLFTVFGAATAMRWFIVLQPILAGLGVYAFLRSERVERPGSTVGGLALALVLAGSSLGLSMPFVGTIAWTALLLAAASRAMRSSTWSARLLWIGAAAVCWGQVANAHLSNGLVMGTGALVAYLAAGGIVALRSGLSTRRGLAGTAVGFLLALPLVNLAVLLPRLAYLPRTTIGRGYDTLDAWARALTGVSTREDVVGLGAAAGWPKGLAVPPGPYLGVLALGLSFAWWRSARHRPLAIAIAAYGLVFYLLSLDVVARALEPLIGGTSWGAFYVHEPIRFVYATVLALCVLAGLGASAVIRARTLRDAAILMIPGAVLWASFLVLARPKDGVGLIVLGAVLVALVAPRLLAHPAWAWALPAIVAVELVSVGLLGEQGAYVVNYEPFRTPTVDVASYMRPGPIVDALRERGITGQRYLAWLPGLDSYGFEGLQGPLSWPSATNQRSMLFGLHDVGGYNPTQLVRTWTFVRAVDPKPIRYNASFLANPRPIALDLFAVRWLVTRGEVPSWATTRGPIALVATDGAWQLSEMPGAAPLASVVDRWAVVANPAAALRSVRAPGFDPRRGVILEGGPGLAMAPGGAAGSAGLTGSDPSTLAFHVTAGAPSVLIVRVPYEQHWHATVDGLPADVLPADYVVMGVPLATGTHAVVLTYDDPTIGLGLLGSAVALLGLGVLAGLLRGRSTLGRAPEEPSHRVRPAGRYAHRTGGE